MVEYEIISERDARYWYDVLKPVLGDKLQAITCSGDRVTSIIVDGELTDVEREKIETLIKEKLRKR